MAKRAALYARYSSDNQRVESITAQLRSAHEYCERKQYTIVNEYRDEAESGKTDDRPAFQEMIRDAKAGLFDTVVFHKIDRNARNEIDYYIYKDKLKKLGVSIEYADQNIDDTPEGALIESVLVGMAAYFSRNLAREAMKGMNENAYSCLHTGGTPPLGYNVGPDKKLAINEIEAQIIRKIFEMRSAGSGYTDIINTMNANGWKTKSGNPFGKNSLYDILCNKKYIGVYIFGKVRTQPNGKRNSRLHSADAIEIPGGVPAIVAIEVWEQVQARMAADRHVGAKYTAKEKYLLSGIARCECGAAMTGSKVTSRGNTFVYYRCDKSHRQAACTARRVSRDEIESEVIAAVEKDVLSVESISRLVKQAMKLQLQLANFHKADIELADRTITEADKKIRRVLDAIMDGTIANSVAKPLMDEQEEKKKAAQGRLKEIKRMLPTVYLKESQMRAVFERFAKSDRSWEDNRAMLDCFVEEVTVTETEFRVHYRIQFLSPDNPQGSGPGGGCRTVSAPHGEARLHHSNPPMIKSREFRGIFAVCDHVRVSGASTIA